MATAHTHLHLYGVPFILNFFLEEPCCKPVYYQVPCCMKYHVACTSTMLHKYHIMKVQCSVHSQVWKYGINRRLVDEEGKAWLIMFSSSSHCPFGIYSPFTDMPDGLWTSIRWIVDTMMQMNHLECGQLAISNATDCHTKGHKNQCAISPWHEDVSFSLPLMEHCLFVIVQDAWCATWYLHACQDKTCMPCKIKRRKEESRKRKEVFATMPITMHKMRVRSLEIQSNKHSVQYAKYHRVEFAILQMQAACMWGQTKIPHTRWNGEDDTLAKKEERKNRKEKKRKTKKRKEKKICRCLNTIATCHTSILKVLGHNPGSLTAGVCVSASWICGVCGAVFRRFCRRLVHRFTPHNPDGGKQPQARQHQAEGMFGPSVVQQRQRGWGLSVFGTELLHSLL